ncbi:unnamed protein product [Camellia sinensis]
MSLPSSREAIIVAGANAIMVLFSLYSLISSSLKRLHSSFYFATATTVGGDQRCRIHGLRSSHLSSPNSKPSISIRGLRPALILHFFHQTTPKPQRRRKFYGLRRSVWQGTFNHDKHVLLSTLDFMEHDSNAFDEAEKEKGNDMR